MDMSEREAYTELLSLLEKELEAPREGQTLLDAFKEQTPKIIEDKKKTVVGLSEIGVKKVLYYLQRDIAGFLLNEEVCSADGTRCESVAVPPL